MLGLLDRVLAGVSWIAAALVVVLLFAGPSLIGAKKSTAAGQTSGSAGQVSGSPGQVSGSPGQVSGSAGQVSGSAGQVSGSAVFASAGCSGCHTLKAAGASGAVGPNLDQLRPSAADVSQIVRSGGGVMPSFSGKLSEAQIAAVASYVSSVAGR
jgi:mono/diheme cytochrome c family protein